MEMLENSSCNTAKKLQIYDSSEYASATTRIMNINITTRTVHEGPGPSVPRYDSEQVALET